MHEMLHAGIITAFLLYCLEVKIIIMELFLHTQYCALQSMAYGKASGT